MEKSYKEILSQIKTLIFDVDGVLTNGKVQVMGNGELIRNMYVRDGYAIKTAVDQGFRVAIISGGTNDAVKTRLNLLGVKDVYLKVYDKLEQFKTYCDMYQIEPSEVLYMGDDVPDLDVMRAVALPCAPQDADSEVLKVARYISHKNGGDGAARDVIEQVLRVQGKWDIEHAPSKFG